jgi:gamma-glutamylputrescine oxidase
MVNNFSFWEKKTWFGGLDIVIIGSGIVGLSTALSLKRRSSRLKILVLERGMLPSGASTKNAGFACFGSPTELLDDLNKSTPDEVFALVKKRKEGLERLRKNLGDRAIDFHAWDGYEVFPASDGQDYESCMEKLNYLNKHVGAILKKKSVYHNADKKIKEFGFKGVAHLIGIKGEAQIDTGKMMKALLEKVTSLGVMVLNGVNVESINEENKKVIIRLSDGMLITAGKAVVTTNGFAKRIFPELEVEPARAQVIVSSPVKGLKLKGTFHMDRGYYYFRNFEDRVLLGGGRNLDFKGEATDSFGITENIQQKLEDILRNTILPGKKVSVEYRWSGIMGLGNVKSTIIKKISPRVYCGVRLGGMGVALGSLVGEELGELIYD